MKNKILYAEDNELLRDMYTEIMGNEFPSHKLEIFETGDSLDKRLQGNLRNVSAVVTDNEMPGINGLEIIEKYASKSGIPFILFYGGNELIGLRARECGAGSVIKSPDIYRIIDVMKKRINHS